MDIQQFFMNVRMSCLLHKRFGRIPFPFTETQGRMHKRTWPECFRRVPLVPAPDLGIFVARICLQGC